MMFNLWRFNPFSTWRGDVWFDLESFLNDLIDDWRIWPFWTFLTLGTFFGGFLWFFFWMSFWKATHVSRSAPEMDLFVLKLVRSPWYTVHYHNLRGLCDLYNCKLARYHSHTHCQDLISHCATIKTSKIIFLFNENLNLILFHPPVLT